MDGKDNSNNRDENKDGKKDDKVERLTQLEQDILAKSHGRGGSVPAVRPGVESMSYSSNSRPGAGLTQLEQDIAAKQNARGTGVTPTAAGLSQLEQDIAAKTQSHGGSTASRPGAVFAGGGNQLTQLERDIAAKTQGQSVIGSSPGGSQFERDAAAKQSARQGVVASSKKLTQLEQDIAAKMQARGGMPSSSTPGAVSSVGMDNLNQLEQGIIAKTQANDISQTVVSRPGAMSSVGVDALNRLEDNIRNKTNAMTAPVVPTSAALHQLESDLSAKQNAAGGGVAVRPVTNKPSDLNNLENEIARKMQSLDPYHSNESRRDVPSPSAAVVAPQIDVAESYHRQIAPETSVYNDANYHLNQYDDNGYSDVPTPPLHYTQSNPSFAPGVRPDAIPYEDPEAPLYPTHGNSVDEAEIGGIEAFVAENVVDATEVAVIMSDEEEEVELKKRQRKLMIRMGLGVVLLLMAVIIPVALLTGGGEVEITPSPTLAPTNFPTLSPTLVELSNLVDDLAIKGISQLIDLQDRNSPQGKAVDWIVNDDSYTDSNGLTIFDVKFIQRYALAVFYFSLGGDLWTACHRNDESCSSTGEVNGWLTNTNECSWFVVACNADGAVSSIEFQEATQDESFKGKLTPLEGTMPSEIGLLSSLERLIIVGMKVSGPILDFINGTEKLTVLDVHSNSFNGSIKESFSKEHPALSYVNLERNAFSGKIPKSIGNFTSLVTFNVQDNQVLGTIPSEIAAIPTLQYLNVGDNLLTGKIPVELYDPKFISLRMTNNVLAGKISTLIGQMRNLTEFTIGSSLMSGSIPTELYQVTTLKVLDLHNSSFTGPLPESGFGNLTGLRHFEVYMNDFTGSIPSTAIANMTNLERLQLQDNDKLTGNITKEICDMRGKAPNTVQTLNVGCNIGCYRDCCDDDDECV